MNRNLLFLSTILSLLISCSDSEPIIPSEPLGAYEKGILISNEGPFANGHGSVTFIDKKLEYIEQNIYQHVNVNDHVGNVLNSIGFSENKAYLIANVSNRITVVDRYTFERKNLIQNGLNNPRYFEAVGTIGFVTNWGNPLDNEDDYVAVIDLTTENVITQIPVSFGPEKMIALGRKLYVAHKGGYGHNNIISVIDADAYEVEAEIQVGDVPGSMVDDFKGNLWVLCEGIPVWTGTETNGSLVRINTNTNEITLELDFGAQNHPQFLTGDTGNLYYNLNGNVYKMRDTDSELPTKEALSGLYFYNMIVSEGILYGLDAKDFASVGSLEVYNIANNAFIKTIPAGIIPGGIYFNN